MLKRFAVAALLSAAVASSAGAVPITYVTQGVVDFVHFAAVTGVAVGDSFTATFTVETSTPGQIGGNANIDTYLDSVTSVSFSIGAYTGGTGAAWDIRVQDAGSFDQFRMAAGQQSGGNAGPIGGGPFGDFSLVLDGGSGAGVVSGALAVPTDVTLFSSTEFSFNAGTVAGHITSIQLVPEPSIAALLAAGVLALALRRRAAA